VVSQAQTGAAREYSDSRASEGGPEGGPRVSAVEKLTLMTILFLPLGPKDVLTISVIWLTAWIFRMTASSMPDWKV
jgi:hypothetical protein